MELTSLQNIGPTIERKLQTVGIITAEDLIQEGSEAAYTRLKSRFPEVCLVHLYTLEGAVSDQPYNTLSDEVKAELKSFSDQFKDE